MRTRLTVRKAERRMHLVRKRIDQLQTMIARRNRAETDPDGTPLAWQRLGAEGLHRELLEQSALLTRLTVAVQVARIDLEPLRSRLDMLRVLRRFYRSLPVGAGRFQEYDDRDWA